MSVEKKVCQLLFQSKDYLASTIMTSIVERNHHGFELNEEELRNLSNVIVGGVDQCVNNMTDQVIKMKLDPPKKPDVKPVATPKKAMNKKK